MTKENFRNDRGPKRQHFYYLYALERAGILYGTEHFGGRAWYAEGAKFLLETQKPDGSWRESDYAGVAPETWDTCFAILFLRRATKPLIDVATVEKR